MPICHRTELRVYDALGRTHLATLPANSPSFTVGVDGGILSASLGYDAAAMYVGNYISNSDYTEDLTGWAGNTIYGTNDLPSSLTRESVDGRWVMKAAWPATSLGANVLTTVDVIKGRSYTARALVYVPTGSPNVRMLVPFYDLGGDYSAVKDQWHEISVDFTAPLTGTVFVGVQVATALAGSWVRVDWAMVSERAASPSFTANRPSLLGDIIDDCVIKVALPLADGAPLDEVAAFAVRASSGDLWAGGQTTVDLQAESLLRAWGKDAIVYPEGNAFLAGTGESRIFGYQSSIYDPSRDAWDTPSESVGSQATATGNRAGKPTTWPAALSGAKWITRGTVNNGTRRLFITDVVVPFGGAYLTVYFSSDESATVYWAGAEVIRTSASETGYETMDKWSAFVAAGTYRLAVDQTTLAARGGDGVDPILVAVATNTDTDGIDTILRVSDAANWRVYTLDPDTGVAPGLTPGQILGQLRTEAAARGVGTWAALRCNFSDTADSSGVAWTSTEERTWRLGYDSYATVLADLAEAGLSVDITPSLELVVRQSAGSDRRTPHTAYSAETVPYSSPTVPYTGVTMALEAGVNTEAVRARGTAADATVMPVQTQAGWVEVSNGPALSTVGRREQALSAGGSPSLSHGRWVGYQALARQSRPTQEWVVELYAFPGCVPLLDFFVGDIINVTIRGVTTARTVTAIAATAASTEAVVSWTVVTGPPSIGPKRIYSPWEQRIARALRFNPGQFSPSPAAQPVTPWRTLGRVGQV